MQCVTSDRYLHRQASENPACPVIGPEDGTADLQDSAAGRSRYHREYQPSQPRSHRQRHDRDHQDIQEHRIRRDLKIEIQHRSQQHQIDRNAGRQAFRTGSGGLLHSDSKRLLYFFRSCSPRPIPHCFPRPAGFLFPAASQQLGDDRTEQPDPEDRSEGEQESGIGQIQRLPCTYDCRRQRQAGGKIIVSPCHIRPNSDKEHDQSSQAGYAGSNHQSIEDKDSAACYSRRDERDSGPAQESVDPHSDKRHVKA